MCGLLRPRPSLSDTAREPQVAFKERRGGRKFSADTSSGSPVRLAPWRSESTLHEQRQNVRRPERMDEAQ